MKINKLLWNNKLHSLTFISAIIGIAVFFSTTKDICSEVNKSIMLGDAQQLSKYLCSMVEMSVLGKEGYFSKVQAESILSEFFKTNPPKDFTVKQGGSTSENTKFSIGTYTTAGGIFKIYYVVKKDQENEFVYKLTIEKK
ncbi:MAG: DUF4783 domain-containing protein [Bacteroidales bacterium]|jgi:hypothetical protein|nr:DUF4783 domain-containing protein [Bacteroidales bacterium]